MRRTPTAILRDVIQILSQFEFKIRSHASSFLCCLCVLCVSVVHLRAKTFVTTETQRAQRQHREKSKLIRGGIENATALESFFQTLKESKSNHRVEPVRIMHFGDSHVAADIWTREIRERFQKEFGDGGPGFLVPRNPMSTRRSGVVSGATEGWVIEGIGGRSSPDAIHGPAGINLATSDPGERIWLQTSCNRFEVYFVRQPGGGKIEIRVDGADVLEGPISLQARAPKVDSVSIELPDDAPHRLELRTLSPGKVRVLGIVAEHLTPGVNYDVFGINGARANRMLEWNQRALADAIKIRNPDLIIIAFGTNEMADGTWAAASYEQLVGEIVKRLHVAAPNSSILVVAPPDRADVQLGGRLQAMVNAQRRAAFANNAAFWSAFNAMGGVGSMNNWVRKGLAQPDRVHLSGVGYARLAEMFYDDLRKAWLLN